MKSFFTPLLYAGLLLASLPAAAQTLSGPVAHWSMNGTANDVSGNGHHGTLHNVTTATGRNGVAGSAYSFNGMSSYISVPASSAWNVTSYTIGAVIKTTAFNTAPCQGNYVIARGKYGNSRWALSYHDNWANSCSVVDTSSFLFFNLPGQPTFSAAATTYTPTITTNTWTVVVATYDGDTSKLYINGVLKSKAKANVTLVAGTDSVLIGQESFDPQYPFPFIGVMDDIRFYNRVLTKSEIDTYGVSTTVVPSPPPTEVAAFSTPISIQVTPNPATAFVDVTLPDGLSGAAVRIANTLGQTLYAGLLTAGSNRIPVAALPAGIYTVLVTTPDQRWTQKIVKN